MRTVIQQLSGVYRLMVQLHLGNGDGNMCFPRKDSLKTLELVGGNVFILFKQGSLSAEPQTTGYAVGMKRTQ